MLLASAVADFIRTIALIGAGFVYLIVGYILVMHWRKSRLERRRGGRGLKPRHVWLVSAAYLVSLTGNVAVAAKAWGEPVYWWRLPILFVSVGFALAALSLIALHLRREGRSWHGGDTEVDAVRPGGREERRSRDDDYRLALALAARFAVPLAILCLLPSLVGFYRTEQVTDDLESNKAQVTQLQKTNCGLKGFLYEAAEARYNTATTALERGDERLYSENISAGDGYVVLADNFTQASTGENCGVLPPERPKPPPSG